MHLIKVFIEVLDENDHIPLTTEPIYWVHVAENSPPKTPVARITALDGDGGRHAKLTFQLKAGNPQSLFDIDPHTGTLQRSRRDTRSFPFSFYGFRMSVRPVDGPDGHMLKERMRRGR